MIGEHNLASSSSSNSVAAAGVERVQGVAFGSSIPGFPRVIARMREAAHPGKAA
jgi:hypothetical protein